jgi:uncharacterized membrane protein YqjE
MPIAHALRQLTSTALGILQTRAELALVEAEEEALRYFTYLLLSLVAVLCLGMVFLLSVTLVVAIYWDTYRITSLLALIGFFLLLAAGLGWKVFASYRRKPRLLDNTLTELRQDATILGDAVRHP